MAESFQVISPADGSVYAERAFATEPHIAIALAAARQAQARWQQQSIAMRAEYCRRFVGVMEARQGEIAEELSWQMGRPVKQAPSEVRGLAERARYMIDIAEEALADIRLPPKEGFTRLIRRVPHGLVLTLAPWNYPYLTAVNSIVPALMAGNVVILKHATQTPLCAERFFGAFVAAGLPEGVFQYLHLTHEQVAGLIEQRAVDYVAFTGSVEGGAAVERAAAGQFLGAGLELGGKDPAYVRADAPFEYTVKNLVDGVFYNAGQSCCAVERIYVHQDLFDDFVEAFVAEARTLRLGHPLDTGTTLGPVVRPSAAAFVREQVDEAIRQGARLVLGPEDFDGPEGACYLAPHVLTGVDHTMRIMTEETFGPAIGLMSVKSDDEAVALMNDSRYGLTASIWTRDEDAALALGARVETGTCFMNRCDYLDPALAWTGVKDSGRGGSLSVVGYEHLTRPKSFHLKTKV